MRPPARNGAGKPDIETKTRAAVITVSIDKKLKGDPALVADLMAEGRRFVAKMRAEADEEYKDPIEGYFRGGRRYTYERGYAFRSLVGNRYLSIVRDDGTYTGGAHPNSRLDTILWDRTQKKRISVRPFFNETADNGPTMTALAALVRRAVTIERQERREGPMNEQREERISREARRDDRQGRAAQGDDPAEPAQARADQPRAVDDARQKLRADVPLLALRCRRLCGRALHRVRALEPI